MMRHFFISNHRLLQGFLWLVFALKANTLRADYLPDAASNLGTIFINGDDQFTADPDVTLAINAVDNGSGVVQMQFSNDDQNWSDPEPYSTNKFWQLETSTNDFPPQMNTVLRTVYVRVQYGDGTWSAPFSDGIVLARSAQDVPAVQDVWIMQQQPANYNSTQPQGSQQNPYIIPPGANEAAFDKLMNSLAKSYVQYEAIPGPNQTNLPPMNTNAVMCLHLGPGIYQTHGDNGGRGGVYSWGPTQGGRIKGAGKNYTTLQLVGGNTNPIARVIGNFNGTGMGLYNNLEISDLTVDANMHEGGNTNSAWVRTGVTLAGNNVQLRRLRVMGFGSRVAGLEPGGMTGFTTSPGNLYNLHIEDCEVTAPQTGNKYNPLMIGYEGGGQDTNGNPYYIYNIVVRNNYVNGLMYDRTNAINPYTSQFTDRGTHGVCLGACTNALIENNLIVHTISGYYNDTFNLSEITVRNNHFRDVIAGLNFNTGVSDNLTFEGNLVELDPHYYTNVVSGTTTPSDYGWRKAVILNEPLQAPIARATVISNIIQFTGAASPMPPLVSGFASASMSGTADIEDNLCYNIQETTVIWYQSQGVAINYYDQQSDIQNPTNPPPFILSNNYRDDGTIIEIYPYFLDNTLPRPVVTANQAVTFAAPSFNGAQPGMVTGLPVTNVVDQFGNFSWTPSSNNIGRYVVSFYSSPSRTNDPKRTLITVLSGLTNQDPMYFASGLTGYWKLGQPVGNAFPDNSLNGNAVLITPIARNYLNLEAPGRFPWQKALHFLNSNPIKGPTLVIPNNNAQLITGYPLAYQPFLQTNTILNQPFSVSYWFNCDHQPTNYEVIFNLNSLVVSGVSHLSSSNTNIANVFCSYGQSPDLTYYQTLHPQNIQVATRAWHQEVFVYDGLSTRLYVDGNLQTEIPCGQLENFSLNNSITLGGGWGGDNYLGSLSDLAIWNRPLSDAEVANLYATQSQGGAFPSLSQPPAVQNLRILH